MMGSYGRPCKRCGARLDPGEKCDCVQRDKEGVGMMAVEKYLKTYVSVIAVHVPGKEPEPLKVRLPDGRSYRIDYAGKPAQAAALKAGGQGLRYEVRVMNKTTYLYLDNDIWFIEEKVRAA